MVDDCWEMNRKNKKGRYKLAFTIWQVFLTHEREGYCIDFYYI